MNRDADHSEALRHREVRRELQACEMHDVPCALERSKLRDERSTIIPDLARQLARAHLVLVAGCDRLRFQRPICGRESAMECCGQPSK